MYDDSILEVGNDKGKGECMPNSSFDLHRYLIFYVVYLWPHI